MPQALRCANTSRLQKETFLQRWFASCYNFGNQSNALAPLHLNFLT
ncbi:hypothetical protein [Nostoc sp.]